MNEKLTREQRDWIRMAVGVARGSNTGIAWAEFYTKLNDYTEDDFEGNREALNELVDELNTAEDELMLHGELDGYVSPDCGCKYCEYGRNQIALQKIEEYQVENSWKLEASDWNAIHRITNWLQQEDK